MFKVTEEQRIQLPDTPSELLELALNDLEKAEKDPLYAVEMGCWHQPDWGYNNETCEDICAVCLAGSVIAFTLKAPIKECLAPSDFDKEIDDKLEALDHFRCGLISDGLAYMGYNSAIGTAIEQDLQGVRIYKYHEDSEKFKGNMRMIINLLKEFRL